MKNEYITSLHELRAAMAERGINRNDCYADGPSTGAGHGRNLPDFDEWNHPDEGDYTAELEKMYAELGIYPGNGEWYQDYNVNQGVKTIIEELLENIPYYEFWEYFEEEGDSE